MESEQDNKYKMPVNDCRGTCKTPIGCSCDKMEDGDEKMSPEDTNSSKPTNDQPNGCCKKLNGLCCKRSGIGCCCKGKNKLEVYDWLNDIPLAQDETQMVEVQFKNTRKGYYLNSNNLELYRGDMVAVEASPGHDVGEVTLTGKLVKLQMRKNNYRGEIKRIYRIAKPNDLERLNEARAKEHKTMLRAREIAEELKLNMKISDVEYQGDGNKAIYYYIADERVDFRQLIKVYASEFRVKIEMKQIGARQEAGRVGGIGPCGRELCCSSSMSNFVSVSTSAARLQDIPLNPQKLAGQCGKLKCCLNFETDVYVEAQRSLPSRDIPLETKDSTFYHFKTDVLAGMMTYSTDKNFAANLVTIPKERVFEIIRINKQGKRPAQLEADNVVQDEKPVSHDVLEQESISRFDEERNRKRKKKKKKPLNKQQADNASSNDNNVEDKSVKKERVIVLNKNPQNTNQPKEQQNSERRDNQNRNRRNRNRPNNRPHQNNKERNDNPKPQE